MRLTASAAALPTRFAQTNAQPDALKTDLGRLSREITQPSEKTKSCLATLIEWFTLGAVWELGESFVQFLLHALKPLLENTGELLTGLFN